MRILNPKPWSPDSPFLYLLQIESGDGPEYDKVTSYFGMRKISLGKDKDGVTRLMLNNKPLFQFGPLDQGFWPDGLYTAPTDEALRSDIEITKKLEDEEGPRKEFTRAQATANAVLGDVDAASAHYGRLKEINRYINIRLAKAICQRFRSFSSSLVFGIGPEKSFKAIWPRCRALVILGIIVTEGGHQFLPLDR